MIGIQIIVPQIVQQGIFQGIPCPVPSGAALVLVQAIMNTGDITSIGSVIGIEAIASPNFGMTWQHAGGIPAWYSGPQTGPSLPSGPSPVNAPAIRVPTWMNMTHYSGVLNLTSLSDVGLTLTFLDANGNVL